MRKSQIIYFKHMTLPFICILFVVLLILFSKTAVTAAAKGLNLWLNVVFPSLFPFFVASEVLNGTGFTRAAGVLLEPIMRPLFNVPGCGSFPFAMGITSGYPVGAKLTAQMREEKLLSKSEGERLLAFCNNSGPLFIVGAVAVGMFKLPEAGLLLLGCHIAACITVGMLFKLYGGTNIAYAAKIKTSPFKRFKIELSAMVSGHRENLGGLFGTAIKNSVLTLLSIGGFIIFFSVAINLLIEIGFVSFVSSFLCSVFSPLGIDSGIFTSIVSGFFEITTGTNMASQATGAPVIQQLTSASVIIGWAGISVHSQVLSIISGTDLSIKPYLLGKLLQGLISGVYTYTVLVITKPDFAKASVVFKSLSPTIQFGWLDYLVNSCTNFIICGVVLLILVLIFYILSLLKIIKSKLYIRLF